MSNFTNNHRLFCRAQIISLHRHGMRPAEIAQFVDCAMSMVYRWTGRAGSDNVMDNPRPGQTPVFDETLQLRLIAFYCQERPLSGRGRWTFRWAAKFLTWFCKIHNNLNFNILPIYHCQCRYTLLF
jgi:transposase